MPRKTSKTSRQYKIIVALTAVAATAFVAYLFFLWRQTREPALVRYEAFGIPIPDKYPIHGIDVSRYQQYISWKAVRDMRVKNIQLGFAFIKATEGVGRVDPFFNRNWRKAKEAGVVRGAYHFFIPWKDGKLQAQQFIKKVALESADLPPVLDIEVLSGVQPARMRIEVQKWLDAVETYYGVKPIIYTNADFYKRYLGDDFDAYPLWVAHYLQPHQPRINREWAFWQHSEAGRVNGIVSKVDFNVFSGDSAQFRALLVP